MTDTRTEATEVEFIRMFFSDLLEEQVAYRWASRLARLVGPRVLELRPKTTLAQMLHWGAISRVDSMDFVVVFEPELRMDFAAFLDASEHATFREMVRHYVASCEQWPQ